MCIDIPGGDVYNGAQLWIWNCISGSSNQNFVAGTNRDGSTIEVNTDSKTFCIDGGDMSSGSRLMLWECGGYHQQNFYCDNDDDGHCGTLESWDGNCVSVPYVTNGAPLELLDCGADGYQKWDSLFRIVNV
eukprot:CAMPEP_0194502408 /NCGR_PEP_ID=MMETSP0253-20130528/25658_1 /TAXON_ID=2966 /ORGANISM="Noctiluca scintillans" /LENGTH=130 /DNA_ID=CAMNT_0039344561 /DNA_START=117 /DNA_END=509 /DNA_ORIENTATION=+